MVVGLRLECQGPITGKVLGPLDRSLGVKALVVIICALVSVIGGIVAGFLKHDPATPKAPAILFGGGAFGGSLTLCLLVMSTLGVLRPCENPGCQDGSPGLRRDNQEGQPVEPPGSISLGWSPGNSRSTMVCGLASMPNAFIAATVLRSSFCFESTTRSMKVVATSSL